MGYQPTQTNDAIGRVAALAADTPGGNLEHLNRTLEP